jgi:Protein of unknown function (DUF2924)
MAFSRTSATQPAFALAESPDAALARIGEMTIEQLRACWRETIGSAPPTAFSKDLLARAICYRLQEQAFGGLSVSTGRLLGSLVKPGVEPPRQVKVGSVLIREHQGVVHEVLVVPGGFCWRGKTYDSLSAIAKKITGTSWNGPRFFGLRSRTHPIRRSTRPPVGLLLTATASPNLRRVRRLPVGPVAAPACRRHPAMREGACEECRSQTPALRYLHAHDLPAI